MSSRCVLLSRFRLLLTILVFTLHDGFYQCKDCSLQYGLAPKICSRCLQSQTPHHRQSHTFWCFTLSSSEATGHNHGWSCRECLFASNFFPFNHEHSTFHWNFSKSLIDAARSRLLRSCYINGAEVRSWRHPSNTVDRKCHTCEIMIGNNKPCLICTKCHIFICDACTQAGRGEHRHELSLGNTATRNKSIPGAKCDGCKRRFQRGSFSGLMCKICGDYFWCLPNCIAKGHDPHAVVSTNSKHGKHLSNEPARWIYLV